MMEPECKMPTCDLDRQKAVAHQSLTLQRDAGHGTGPDPNLSHDPFAQRVFAIVILPKCMTASASVS